MESTAQEDFFRDGSNMKKILIVIGTYLPGYNAGGPVRSIKNLVDFLGKEFEFRILTMDRDLGDKKPYSGIIANQWNTVEGAKVYYVKPGGFTRQTILNVVKGMDYIYVCGCFNDYARQIIWMNKSNELKVPVIVASMGLFSPGAFHIKKMKKTIYMKLLGMLGMWKNITWAATSEEEVREIKNVVGEKAICVIATDLPRKNEMNFIPLTKISGEIKIVFLSRISIKKNLTYALNIIKTIKGKVIFDIYGPIQDETYWKKCMEIIQNLPENIVCRYQGNAHTDEVEHIFSKYHIMLFPTLGENYGHVIVEAMSAGCVPVISDKTPWKGLDGRCAGFAVRLDEIDIFRSVVQKITNMGTEYEKYRKGAYKFAKELNRSEKNLQMYRNIFQ